MNAAAYRDFVIEIVCRAGKEPRFTALPRQRFVECTFGWVLCTSWSLYKAGGIVGMERYRIANNNARPFQGP